MPATSPSSNPMGSRSGMWPLRRASTNWRSSGSSGGASHCGSIPLQRTDCFQLDGDAALRLSFLFWVLVRQEELRWRREGSGVWPFLATFRRKNSEENRVVFVGGRLRLWEKMPVCVGGKFRHGGD